MYRDRRTSQASTTTERVQRGRGGGGGESGERRTGDVRGNGWLMGWKDAYNIQPRKFNFYFYLEKCCALLSRVCVRIQTHMAEFLRWTLTHSTLLIFFPLLCAQALTVFSDSQIPVHLCLLQLCECVCNCECILEQRAKWLDFGWMGRCLRNERK
jgi:hypothetical protein